MMLYFCIRYVLLYSVYEIKAMIVLDASGELTTLITWIEGEYLGIGNDYGREN